MHMTNVEFVVDLMEFSQHGALSQVFVIDALQKHADRVAAADPRILDHGFISGERWVSVAKEIQGKLNAKYGAASEPSSVGAEPLTS
ncbi:hypothetical protein NU688_33140 [Variovorax sp. ZS18.2.2]|uniref:hypothetical protein n=1 Tax=Variovorax sp. ZS18.2.2 TaxID=2971255 RepID=UPI0021513D14|nr:hypothetical protein [Variovorax sp. ZS18.2.2]MCR6481044.1 hypothetical protein [Variovorax sp. ZS18.2.2]